MFVIVVFAVMFIFSISIIFWGSTSVVFSAESQNVYGIQEQKVHDPGLKVEKVYDGLEYPTSMTFIGPDDILVTEKDKGTVQRIIDGKKLPQPVFDAAVANENERGLLGIVYMNSKGSSHVYLYFTESDNNNDDSDYCPEIISCMYGNDPLGADYTDTI